MTATITLSLEIELGWGFHDKPHGSELFSDQCRVEHRTLDRLLDACDRFGVPMSFDVVGGLLNDPGHGREPSPHPDGWWPSDLDDESAASLYYAPDVVDRIRSRDVEHEICTHTYTHIPCAEFSDEVLDWELQRSSAVHRRRGLPSPTSIVPPRHSPPTREVLRRNGIDCVRVPSTEPPASNVASFAYYLTRTHPVREPALQDGVVETYTSMNTSLTAPYLQIGQKSPHLAFRTIPRTVRERIHRRYMDRALERAIEADSYAHLWSHLFNLSNDVQYPLVRDFLERLGAAHDRGAVEFATMADVADGTLR